ncbi:6-phosphofructokinase [Holophaga foetida]|uniref:6-phosphofructokinase n=1 Tax=Holophaga foetida TaxID=35839 RepID=UPI0002472B00|nr:6-phosphofructokinase [Holophaga foetida]
MSKLEGKAVVAQGGGPTGVINQSLVGVVLESREYSQITHVYGARHGVRGILNEDFIDLSQTTTHNLERVAISPCSALGSTRDKPDEEYCEKIFRVLRAHEVRYFFYIGGNDSADTSRIIRDYAVRDGYELRVLHIPKTIDNDLLVTDHCPGYGSAAKFVVQSFMGLNLDNHALPGVYLGVVMGREAGWLTASSVFARRFPDDGPHLIYLPEHNFDFEQFLTDVDHVYQAKGRCVVAVCEGIMDASRTPIMSRLQSREERDAHGNVQLSGSGALADALANAVKTRLQIKRVRADTFGYLQRSFPGVVSEVDSEEAREVGERAVQFAVWGENAGSVAIRRTGDYSSEYFLTSLESVAGNTKSMPPGFILGDNDVTTAFKDYARPLIGPLPRYDQLSAPKVKKLLSHP